jgi:serine/threonine protein kinase
MDFGKTFYDLRTRADGDAIDEVDNPLVYRLSEPNSRHPPESQPSDTNFTQITSASDVWDIGAIMFDLMSHYYHGKVPRLDPVGAPRHPPGSKQRPLVNHAPFNPADLMTGTDFPILDPTNGPYGGSPLFNWVRQCMAHNPTQRPTLSQLKTAIDAQLALPQVGRMARDDPHLYRPALLIGMKSMHGHC